MSQTDELRPGGRHRGREVALQVLYAIDLGETGPRDARAARAARASRDFELRDGALLERPKLADATSDPAQAVTDRAPEAADPLLVSGEAFDRIAEHFVVPASAIAFARELVERVAAGVVELDAIVGQHARNWRVSRMAAVDRNVLRLAVYELRDTDTPVAVVIDEAVDLARRFGSDTSPSFVNGVLDAVAREVRAA